MLLLTLTLVNCQKDNIQEQEKTTVKVPPNLKATIKRGGKLLKANKTLNQQLSKLLINNKTEKNTTASRTIYSSQYNLSIDTTFIQLIETASYKSYTFIVERDNPNPDVLENYVLTNFNDDTSKQYLITYPILNSSSDQEYDIANATVQPINDDILTYSSDTSSCASLVEYEEPVCVDIPCQNNGGPTHILSQGAACALWGSIYMATQTCTGGGWVDTGCGDPTSGGGTTNPTDPTDTTNGGSPNTDPPTDPTTQEEDLVVVAFGQKRECKKITNFLNNPDNAAFKQKLNDFANPANYSQNLDIEFEKSITAHENETVLQERAGTNGTASVDISYVLTHPNKTKAWLHTQPNDTEGTYSVFSFDDLIAISRILANDKLDTGTFVAFLITKKGDNVTKYALTINNKTKFKNFFYNYQDFNFASATQEQKDKRVSASEKSDPIRTKYYDHKTNPRINNFNVNSEQMLTEFLKLMEEADMGTTMFEAIPSLDDSINNYSALTLDGTNVIRKPCNN